MLAQTVTDVVDQESLFSAATIHVVSGAASVLRLRQVLAGLSARCDQLGVMDDIEYFLSKPGRLKRVPCLLLVSKTPALNLNQLSPEDLFGAILLYRYKILGLGIGIYTTNDRSGRGSMVAPIALRSAMAKKVSSWLMDRGAFSVMISFRAGSTEPAKPDGSSRSRDSIVQDRIARWVWRERDTPDYLPLKKTFDETLATIGQRTRSNLRYYRRRAERDLGCTFIPEIQMDRTEFLAFNGECMYAVPSKIAAWRYDSITKMSDPILMGVKDKDGRWLSLLGGRRHHGETEILWQMNRDGLSVYSLSIVMRSYFLEHEIGRQMVRLSIEGGTSHPMRYSFVKATMTDLVVLRRSWSTVLISKFAKHFVKYDNELALMLLDKNLYGDSADTNPSPGSEEEAN
jgi:hypothetical protein